MEPEECNIRERERERERERARERERERERGESVTGLLANKKQELVGRRQCQKRSVGGKANKNVPKRQQGMQVEHVQGDNNKRM